MSNNGQPAMWTLSYRICLAVVLGGMALSAQEPAAPSKPNPNTIEAAVTVLGASDLRSIRYSGTGYLHVSGQRLLTPGAGERIALKSYDVAIDYPASAMSVEIVREGGASGEAAATDRHIQAVSGATAWDVSFAPASDPAINRTSARKPSTFTKAPADRSNSAGVVPGLVAQAPQVNPGAAVERRYAIWVTPHGFLKAALANQPALRPAGAGTEVSFYSGAQRFVGFVNSKNQVERVRIWIKQPSGDLLIDTTYTDYATFGQVSFPTRIVQTLTGQPTLTLPRPAVSARSANDGPKLSLLRVSVPRAGSNV